HRWAALSRGLVSRCFKRRDGTSYGTGRTYRSAIPDVPVGWRASVILGGRHLPTAPRVGPDMECRRGGLGVVRRRIRGTGPIAARGGSPTNRTPTGAWRFLPDDAVEQ